MMPRCCIYTKRTLHAGRHYTIRGIAKKHKGIGLKTTSKTKRWFYPNLQKKQVWSNCSKSKKTVVLSTRALRTAKKHGVHTHEEMLSIM